MYSTFMGTNPAWARIQVRIFFVCEVFANWQMQMKMKDKTPTRKLVALLVLATAISISALGQTPQPVSEQTKFSRTSRIEHPVPVPPDVLKLLLNTREGKEGMARASDLQKQNPGQMFRAAEVHLRGADEPDLVIEGVAPMANGDHDWFWIVIPVGKRPRLVLFAGGNSLEVQDSRTNAYRDISTVWIYPKETLVSIYKFNGKTYAFKKVMSRAPRK